jgi:hypothetical protein
MLVPVSPSGTGKTFKAFMAEALLSSETVADYMSSKKCEPEYELV